ncbi:MAG: helicase-related protein [Candidatus Bathyarchaeota archaeon]|nr:helicase-related protein [Candidatus Bathyarchaeota archaeon]MDH5786823.1 helicase-related protein [Candidatus Bathyarchaeota archaeon]
MTKIIDNSKETLASALCKEFCDLSEIAIASAYFNIRGYGALRQALQGKPLLFLLGREPTESIKWEEEVLRELEEKEDDRDYFKLLQDAIKYFEDSKTQIRTVTGPFFHGKAYIGANPSLKEARNGVGSVGSSNFTYGGLVYNKELNMLNTDREVVKELIEWFFNQWNTAQDFKETFLSFLKNYVTTRSPYEVVAKALYETYKTNIEVSAENLKLKTLYAHQILSFRDASAKLEAHHGVIIADATGLGKTRTALRVALDAIRDGKKILLVAPKSILDTTWDDEMEKTNIHLKCVSSEKLSSDPDSVVKHFSDRDFIIVDEAHYYRSPSTNRYAALRDLIIKQNAQVVLATATPVNNSLMDLYFLLSLYLKEDSINDLTGQTLKGYFTANQKRWLQHQKIEMEPVLERFIVRHSRELAKALDKEGKLDFPQRVLDSDPRCKYTTNIDYQKIDEMLDKMNFTFYDLSVDKIAGQMKLPDGAPISQAVEATNREFLKKLIKIIIVINIFKRLESSVEAFRATLTSLDEYIVKATKYAQEKGYFVPPALKGDPLFTLDEGIPDPEELFSKPKYAAMINSLKLTSQEVKEFISNCNEDREMIKKLIGVIPPTDKKCNQFKDRLADIIKQISLDSNNGVIIFSQYTATATYLHDRLKDEKFKHPILLTTGTICKDREGKHSNKTSVIRDFQKGGGILVSTDVLSEGQNLQNAQYVINYDFPWNPVVLIQRIGRIDRMLSQHEVVYLTNLLPKNGDPNDPASLEHFIGLMQKLYSRLEAIRSTIGLDASTLGEEAAPKDFGFQEAIAKNDPTLLDVMTKELEQFTNSPMDALAKIMSEKGLDWLQSLPKGIGAYKQGRRQGLFILFNDGEDYYWRLKYYDKGKETISSPNEIINVLLQGENKNSGENIAYEKLIERMIQIKQELKTEIEASKRREKAIEGFPVRATYIIKEIYDELAKSSEEGEKLAIAFRKASSRQSVVTALNRARREGSLLQKARELLLKEEPPPTAQTAEDKETKLTRVCWCWIQP